MLFTFKKLKIKKGSGEAIAFMMTLPAILILVFGMITIVKLTMLKQRMEYTAYAACRAAVVSNTDNISDAQENARKVAELELSSFNSICDVEALDVSIETAGKFPVKIENYDGRTGKKVKGNWQKGYLVKCTLTVSLNDNNIFLSGEKECTVYMAIEKENY